MTEKIRFGLVGTGRIGYLHAQTLAQRVPQAELVTLTDINKDSASRCADDFNVANVADNFEQILEDDSIQAVVIASSTDTHAPFMKLAAQAGKHIFCEKPIAPDMALIDDALTAVDQAGVKLMIGFHRRFDPTFARIKQAIDTGEIGTPHLMHMISRDPAPPPLEYIKVSGGIFFDMTIHDFDMSRHLLGEVDEIYAAGAVRVDPAIAGIGDVDTTLITLKFTSGAIGTIDNSRKSAYGYDQRVEIFGSKGSAATGNLYADEVTFSTADNIHRGLPLNFFMDRYVTAYENELKAFADCILNDTESPVTGYDGRQPVVMGLAAKKSIKENRPVKLTEIEA